MKKLLNTLYVTTPDVYLGLDGENVVIKKDSDILMRLPLHNLEAIVTFNYTGASPALIRKCAEMQIMISLFQGDRFCGRYVGQENGNVILRKTQYRFSDDDRESLKIAGNMILGKVHNAKYVIDRALRDHALQVDAAKLKNASELLGNALGRIREAEDLESLRGCEGEAASVYFRVFDQLILRDKESFQFTGRNKRPPQDRVNALLSFAYSLLANECAGAAYSVGLDPYVGFLHRDRPGRESLALDIMEELRCPVADQFVLNLINRHEISPEDFRETESHAVIMSDGARKKVIQKWQETKQDTIMHPFLQEKISVGLIPYVQAMLLARYLRGDLDEYPPYFKR